nr:MAG TPA: hypothetical protein [Myoviridae sp. ct6nn14]
MLLSGVEAFNNYACFDSILYKYTTLANAKKQ